MIESMFDKTVLTCIYRTFAFFQLKPVIVEFLGKLILCILIFKRRSPTLDFFYFDIRVVCSYVLVWTTKNQLDIFQVVIDNVLKDIHPDNIIFDTSSCQLLVGCSKITENNIVIFFIYVIEQRFVVVFCVKFRAYNFKCDPCLLGLPTMLIFKFKFEYTRLI